MAGARRGPDKPLRYRGRIVTSLQDTYLPRATAGLKPGRIFHLGNYFGTLRKVIEAQEKWPGQNFLFVADLHSSIHTGGKSVSRSEVYAVVKGCLHLGIDPAKT